MRELLSVSVPTVGAVLEPSPVLLLVFGRSRYPTLKICRVPMFQVILPYSSWPLWMLSGSGVPSLLVRPCPSVALKYRADPYQNREFWMNGPPTPTAGVTNGTTDESRNAVLRNSPIKAFGCQSTRPIPRSGSRPTGSRHW